MKFNSYILASILESLRNPLLFENPYHFEISGQLQERIKFSRIYLEVCVSVLRDKGE